MANAYINLNNVGLENLVNSKSVIDVSNADAKKVVEFEGSKYAIFAECIFLAIGVYAVKENDEVFTAKHDGKMYAKIHRLHINIDDLVEYDKKSFSEMEVINDMTLNEDEIEWHCDKSDKFTLQDIMMVC